MDVSGIFKVTDWLPFLFKLLCLFFKTRFHYVTQAGPQTCDTPASVFRVLGIQACATHSCLRILHMYFMYIGYSPYDRFISPSIVNQLPLYILH